MCYLQLENKIENSNLKEILEYYKSMCIYENCLGYLSGAMCKWLAYSPDDTSCFIMISCFIKIENSLIFLALAYQDCPRKEASISNCYVLLIN